MNTKTIKKVYHPDNKKKFILLDDDSLQTGDIVNLDNGISIVKNSLGEWSKYDSHVGCMNYPNCDEAGCGGDK